MKLSTILAALCCTLARSPGSHATRIPNVHAGRPLDMIREPHLPLPARDANTAANTAAAPPQLQDLITYDEHSLFIRGERTMIFSGSVHPFRLPVPDLYLDVFQKT
jgi:hypothetical protein